MANDFKRGIKVYLETSDYGKGIDAMVAATKKYETELENLTAESKKMTAEGKNSGKAWDDLQKQLKAYEKQIGKSQATEADYRAKLQQTELVLNNLSGVSYNELVAVQKQLQKELKATTRGTEEHKTKLEQLERANKEVSKAQGEMNSNLGKSEGFLSKAANGVNKYFNVFVGFVAGITGMSLAFRKLAEDVAHMDDVYSDVMKTTGKTRDEVLLLNEEFKKIDTRTSRESLNLLARDAGKLGKTATQDILDFVDAGNQINVALGEDLGEDAIKNIGKMVGVFENATKQLQGVGLKEQMLAVGSAVNELGASSTASEPFLVQFAGRLGGISKQAKISMGDILGFASALDQDMQQVEMSATALQQFIMKILGEPAKFAKIAGMSVSHFNNLLANDTNYAIKTVLKSLNEKGGFQALIPIFNDMNLDGARAVGVLSTMAGSISKIDEAQKVANKSMWEGTSITKEYNIKNNNLAAELDKAKKRFNETALELGESLNPMLLKSVKGTTYLIKALVELPKWLKENKGLLVTLTVVMVAYTLAVNRARLANLAALVVEKSKIIWSKASTAATLLQVAVTGYLTGGIRAANLASKAFFVTLGLNPFVAIGIAITAVTIGLYKYISAKTAAGEAHKIFNDRVKEENELMEQHSKAVLDDKANIEALVGAIMLVNNNNELRSKLISELNEKYPRFISFMKDEKISNDVLLAALKDVNDQYSIRIRNAALISKAESFDDAAVKVAKRRIEIEEEIKTLSKEITEDARERIAELNKEDRQLQRNMIAYGQHSAKYRAEASLNDQEIKKMNTVGYAQSQIKVWFDAAHDFESKYKDARDKGLTEQSTYYQKQMTQANNYVKFYKTKRDELAKIEKERLLSGENKNSPFKPAGDGNKTDPFVKELKNKENAYKENQLKIMEQRRLGQINEDDFNEKALKNQLQFFYSKRKLELKYGKETIDTDMDISTQRLKIGQDADNSSLNAIKEIRESGIAALESGENRKIELLQDALNKGVISEKEYNTEIKKLTVELETAKLALAEASFEALKKVKFNDKETQKTALENAIKEIEVLKAALIKAQGDVAKDAAKTVEKSTLTVAERMESIFGKSFSNIGNLFTSFTESLNKLKDGDLKSWSDWGNAIGGIVQGALTVANEINDEYFANKAAGLEADKQRELKNAGDNADAREAINQKYAKKELDLKKKQSSADTVLKVAQAVAAGGLAIVQAFAQLGPIGGAIAAILVGGITTLQVGTILKQNAAIQATSLDSSTSSSSSSTNYGSGSLVARVPQAASGRWDVIGDDDGRVYRNVPYRGVARTGMLTTPTLMGEQGNEIVIDNPTTRNLIMNAPWVVSEIMKHRVPQRAAGKYDAVSTNKSSSSAASSQGNDAVFALIIEMIAKNNALLEYLRANGVDAVFVIDEFERKQLLRNKSKMKGSL